MKPERKHELEHNDLDDMLGKTARFFRENAIALALAAGVAILAVVTYVLLIAGRAADAPAGMWNDYFAALSDANPGAELELLADKHRGSTEPAVLWAKLSAGESQLARAAQEMFSDRTAAAESLKAAEENFKAVESAARTPLLRDRARIGLGEVYESQGNIDEALKWYRLVLTASPDTAQAKAAARAQTRLTSEANREFVAWFAEQKPVRIPRTTGGLPFHSPSTPEIPGFSLPGLGGDDPLQFPGATPRSTTPPDRPVPPAGDESPTGDDPLNGDPVNGDPMNVGPSGVAPAIDGDGDATPPTDPEGGNLPTDVPTPDEQP